MNVHLNEMAAQQENTIASVSGNMQAISELSGVSTGELEGNFERVAALADVNDRLNQRLRKYRHE